MKLEEIKPGMRFTVAEGLTGSLVSEISDHVLDYQVLKGAHGLVTSVDLENRRFRVYFPPQMGVLGTWQPKITISEDWLGKWLIFPDDELPEHSDH